MSRLTITLSEARYRALKEAAVQRDKTIGQLIDESLDFYGIKSREDARDLVRRARERSRLPDDQALAMLQRHSWPGNVRELANAIERAVVMSTGKQIFAEDLPASIVNASTPEGDAPAADERSLKMQVRNFEAQVISQALQRNQGNRSRTANELGISRRALIYKLHECQLDDKADLSDDCANSGLPCA